MNNCVYEIRQGQIQTAARLERLGAERKRVRAAPAVLVVDVNRLLKTMGGSVIYWTRHLCSVSSPLLKRGSFALE